LWQQCPAGSCGIDWTFCSWSRNHPCDLCPIV
jgi:hypothetical protein